MPPVTTNTLDEDVCYTVDIYGEKKFEILFFFLNFCLNDQPVLPLI